MHRILGRLRTLMQREVRCSDLAKELTRDKIGLEIGGPSQVFSKKFMPIYDSVRTLDNCDFSSQTTWAEHSSDFVFSKVRPAGRNIFAEGSDLSSIADATYDFVLSCHNLEHFANPVKALKEWQRVARPKGTLILVVPNYRHTFDHHRNPTSVAHMLNDYEQATPETDLTHVDEILAKHDLGRDRGAGSPDEFRKRSLANFENRCLHHHVFDENNIRELLVSLGMEVLAVETAWPVHIFVIARFGARESGTNKSTKPAIKMNPHG